MKFAASTLLALAAFATPAFAAAPAFAAPISPAPATPTETKPVEVQHNFVLHNFHTESGVVLPEAKIVYETYGRLAPPEGPNGGRKAVLISHGMSAAFSTGSHA